MRKEKCDRGSGERLCSSHILGFFGLNYDS